MSIEQKRCIHVKRDPYISNEMGTCMKGELSRSKENYAHVSNEIQKCEERLIHIKRDSYMPKEIGKCQKRLIYIKKD